MKDPWYKIALKHNALGANLSLNVPHDVFSTQQIDEGTLLLLGHLPNSKPRVVLDMGCGYGALGLPIAAVYPQTMVEMVDRDLLAVKWSNLNATSNKLTNVKIYGSLGYRDLNSKQNYDWILCNVPARIGRPFIEHLLISGRSRLRDTGELRIVVINDLNSTLNQIVDETNLPLVKIIQGTRHSIFSLSPDSSTKNVPDKKYLEPNHLYLRDQVEIGDLKLDRPFDWGGDDPKRLMAGLPTLIDVLPRQWSGTILCFRSGYGQLPLVSRKRWKDCKVVAVDRDLLATTFTRRNAKQLHLDGDLLEIRESAYFSEAILPNEKFDLILGELSPSAGEGVALYELNTISKILKPNGKALVYYLEKLEREWIRPWAIKNKHSANPLIQREGYVVRSF